MTGSQPTFVRLIYILNTLDVNARGGLLKVFPYSLPSKGVHDRQAGKSLQFSCRRLQVQSRNRLTGRAVESNPLH